MTTLLPIALMYGARNYEYTYGYTKDGQIYLDEYFPNAQELLYRGKSASLYLERGLLLKDGAEAEYYRSHYPESCALAEQEMKRSATI